MKNLLMLVAILILAMCSGCIAAMAARSQELKDLSPEQITALKDANLDLYGCFQLGGPPPIGATTFIVMPKGHKVDVSFLPNCMVQMR